MGGDGRWYGRTASAPPALGRLLIVDDNRRYARALEAHAYDQGAGAVTCARSAAQGIALLGEDGGGFDTVITDLSMEEELAGLRVIRHLRERRYAGTLAVASTAIDTPLGFAVNLLVFALPYRTDYMIPKRPIRRGGGVLWIPSLGRRRPEAGPAMERRPAAKI